MDLLALLESVVADSSRHANSSSARVADTIVTKIEIYLELLDDFVVFLSNLPMSSDTTSFYHKSLELQSVISHLLVLWQTRLLQLNSQPQGRGRPKVFLNVEMASVDHQ